MNSRPLVAALSMATFSIIYSSNVIAPLVTQMAADFAVTAGTIGVVAAAYALPGIVTGALAGPFSDRFGRRVFLVGGASVVGLGTIASAVMPSLLLVTICRGLAGIGAAVVLPNMMATVADHFGPDRRARIISTVFLANTMGGLVGVAATGIIAEHLGWRVALGLAGAGALAAALATALAPMRRAPPTNTRFFTSLRTVLVDRGALALLASNYLGAVALQVWSLYMVVFFERTYGVERDVASTYALSLGVGFLVGTQLGPNAQSRIGARGSLALSLGGFAVLILGLSSLSVALPIAIGVLFAGGLLYGLRATANAVLMTEQVPTARSTIFGLSQTTVAASNATASSGGGVALDLVGFPAIGVISAASAVGSAALVITLVREVVGRAPAVAVTETGPIAPAG